MEEREYDRLVALADGGDEDAARALFSEAQRRGDLATTQRAAAVAGNTRSAVRSYKLTRTKRLRPSEPDWSRELNQEQLEVVKAGSGPLLVIAGAGSGKTRTLTYRVARLLHLGTRPERIALLTFTNRAAREMIRRVDALVDGQAERVWGGTFHSVGHRLLRRHAASLGYPESFVIMDAADCATLMTACVAELGLSSNKRRFPRGDVIQNILSTAINTVRPLEAVVLDRYPQYRELVEEIRQVCAHYLTRKQGAALMDYDDLLVNWHRLLTEVPDVGAELTQQFEHVLVDEYQDTNRLQADLVDRMSSGHGNLMVVGDDCQSIYAFRGANHENILQFPNRHRGARRFMLETNYRSSPEIIALANASIRHNVHRFDKTLVAARGRGPLPVLVPARDAIQQAQFVAERILELHETGIPLRDIAVLYRAHYQSVEIQLELTRAQVPFVVRSGMRFFEQAHVKDALSFLRFVYNPRDELSFNRIATLTRGIGGSTALALWRELEQSESPLELLASRRLLPLVPREAARHEFSKTIGLLKQLATPDLANMPGEMVGMVVDHEAYVEHVRSEYRNAENRLQDLEQLSRYAAQFDSLEDFLGELALISGLTGEDIEGDGENRDRDHVILSSVHQAKGLEWNAVFVTSLWDGGFPGRGSVGQPEQEEEERRLFYVAVTRARDELYLTYPLSRQDRRGIRRVLRASQFVSELYEPTVPPSTTLLEEWAISE